MPKPDEVMNNEVKPLKKADIDAQLADISLKEREADLRIKQAKLAEIEQREHRIKAQNATREASLKEFNAVQRQEKMACNHMKGGTDGNAKIGTGDAQNNFSVFINRYPNGERVVHCTRCQMEWHPGDTGEYLVRWGRKIKNPTGISYKHALVMASRSTNKESSAIQFSIVKNEPSEATTPAKEEYPDE